MLVNVTKESLLHALQHVLKAVVANSPNPILSGLHIQAYEKALVFTASNTSMTIQYRVPEDKDSMNVQRTGGIVVPARYLIEIIRRLHAGWIAFESEEPFILSITSGDSHVRLCGLDPAEFPPVHSLSTDAEPACKFQIQNDVLRSAIRQVCVAASTSDSRPVLTGVSFEFTGEYLNLMATDGIRFASRTLHTGYNISNGTNVIVPAKNINEIVKMLSEDNAATEIAVSRHQISFTAKELHVQSVLIEGVFPSAVKNVIPQSCKSELLIGPYGFLQAVERVSILAGGNIIRLTAASGKLVLLSGTADIGEVRDEISLENMEGDDFTIALNGRFLLDILRCLDSGNLRVRYTGKESPVVILTSDPLSPALFLITPVRTHD